MNALPPASAAVRTTCPYCGVGCGILARPDGNGGAIVAGDPDHPSNAGLLCSKGSALGDTLALDHRLLHPMMRGADAEPVEVSWEQALGAVADGLGRIARAHGPDAIAFYLSGQLLTEDYYVANKLMKGFIGSANVDTNSRLCMASSVAGHRRAFGADIVPGIYEDIDLADLIILVGSNAAWCHPVLYRRMIKNKRVRGARIVVVDPRRTATAEDADMFLPIEPGMDATLFSGLLVHLSDSGTLNFDYIERHTSGFAHALAAARQFAGSVETTAKLCGLPPADVARFFDLFARTEKTLTCYSQGVNQSAQGTDKVTSIINCHLATARIGRPGMGPFSLTGQPNAMGGREVGGLANQLAAHMSFEPQHIDRVRRFWRAPRMAESEGLKTVQMFEAIERGEIRALWVMATNPAVSLPRAGRMAQALRKLDFLAISENVRANDTLACRPHVLMPAAAWGEKDGTVTNSERRISRQRAFLAPPGEARPDWWIVSQVARRMGFSGFDYRCAADIFREHAALSAFENDGARDFDIGDYAGISDDEFDALSPFHWPARNGARGTDARFFAQGGFFTADRKARFHAPVRPALRRPTSQRFPYRLNTGRIRDQWHTMTRTGLSPRLGAHLPEPFVEIHPQDAAAIGLRQGDFARLISDHGSCILKVVVSDDQRRGSLFAPIHWSRSTSATCVGDLVTADTDPHSGQPEAKATPVAIEPAPFAFRGFILSRQPVELPPHTWWSKVALARGHGFLIASNEGPVSWQGMAPRIFGPEPAAEYLDAERGSYRIIRFNAGRIDACLFIGPAQSAPSWDGMRVLFEAPEPPRAERRVLLSGKTADGIADAGALVCACFGVGANAVREAIASGLAANVEEIGKALRAGTNCGSCLPELKRIVSDERAKAV